MIVRKLIIFTALDIERRAVDRALKRLHGSDSGNRAPLEIEKITIGIRASLAVDWQPLIQRARHVQGVCVIMAGLAGALDPRLGVGDVIVDSPDIEVSHASFRLGKIHTALDLISTPQQKANLFQATGALAVDMETALIRKAAADFQIPMISIRAISDTAGTPVDPALLSLVDDRGRPKAIPLALALVRQPLLAVSLSRLGRDTKFALRCLSVGVGQLIRVLAER